MFYKIGSFVGQMIISNQSIGCYTVHGIPIKFILFFQRLVVFISFFIAHPFLREKMATNWKNMPLIGNALRIQFMILKFKIKQQRHVQQAYFSMSFTGIIWLLSVLIAYAQGKKNDILCERYNCVQKTKTENITSKFDSFMLQKKQRHRRMKANQRHHELL